MLKKKPDAAAGGLIGARIYVVARVVVCSSITISVVLELNPVGPISGPFLFLLYSLRSHTVFFVCGLQVGTSGKFILSQVGSTANKLTIRPSFKHGSLFCLYWFKERCSAGAGTPAGAHWCHPSARVSLLLSFVLAASRGLPAGKGRSAASLGVPLPGPRAPGCRFARRGAGGGRCPPPRRARGVRGPRRLRVLRQG